MNMMSQPTLSRLLWLVLIACSAIAQAPEPAQFHHIHLKSANSAAAIDYFVRNHGGVKASLPGVGTGVKLDKSYLLFDPIAESEAAKVQIADWPTAWDCPEPQRCFEDERTRLEMFSPFGPPAARLQILSRDPEAARQWFLTHLGVGPALTQADILFVSSRGRLEAGRVIDHLAFSYPNLAPVMDRLQREGVKILQRERASAFVEGPEGLRVEIVEDSESGANLYWCPMDPKIRSAKPGKCPICGMTLVPLDPGEYVEYPVELRTIPNPIRAGQPGKLIFTIFQPHREVPVKSFETVHDKLFHLFIVSYDLSFFEHIHPEPQKDNTWVIETTLPKPGPYQAFTDFFPSGGTPQVVAKTFVTAGYTGTVLDARAHLTPDTVFDKIISGTRIHLDSTGYVSGTKQSLTFSLFDEKTGQPINDLELYLGARAHMLILSEDLGDYVHGHAEVVPGSDSQSQLVIETMFPRPSNYRIWIQFQRAGRVITVFFTVGVHKLG